MRSFVVMSGILAMTLGAWALPTSWHSVDPEPNAFGWNNTPVSVTIEASGSSGLQVCYRLNGGGPICQVPPITFTISSEGIHTVEYWAVDDEGMEPASHRFIVRIDLTPPTIRIRVPASGEKYLLHGKIVTDWFAYDRLSGIAFLDASQESGVPLDTNFPGFHTFYVVARDRAGNTAREEVDYQVICQIETVLPTGFFLDRLLPPEEQVLAWKFPVKARYVQGEPVVIAFRLLDAAGQPGPWARPNVLLTQVRPDPEFEEKHTIWAWLMIPYDQEAGFYKLVYDTSEREPGIYDLWLGFGDGQSQRIRIEILPKS